MKYSAAILAAGVLTLGTPALAQVNEPAPAYKVDPKVEIVERNNRGTATKVRIEGKVYSVCMSEAEDSCIQPRAAGLGWGDRPLSYWPGQSVTESRGG